MTTETLGAAALGAAPTSFHLEATSWPTVPAAFSASIEERFRTRTIEVFSTIESLVERGCCSDAELVVVSDMLHKLAGTAGYFKKPALGDLAGEIERAIPTWDSNHRAALLSGALTALRQAS